MAKREGFFGTDNLHRAGWAALLGLAGFLGALSYYKSFGPQRVVVEATHAVQDRQVTTEVSPRSKDISDLAEAIRQLSKATGANADQKRLRELATEVDRLRAEVAQAKRAAVPSPSTNLSGAAHGSATSSTSLATGGRAAQFRLPDSVDGYTSEKIFGVSALMCPPGVVIPGSTLTVGFSLNDRSLLSRASPLRVTVDKVRSPTDLLQITETWIDMQLGTNEVALAPSLKPGKYRLSYGFYLREKLSGSFPPFYSRECSFEVKEI